MTSSTTTPRPTLADEAFVRCLAEALLDQAARLGVVVTIDCQSVPPLAMGRTTPVIHTWPALRPQLPHAQTPADTPARSGVAACIHGMHNVLATDTAARGAA